MAEFSGYFNDAAAGEGFAGAGPGPLHERPRFPVYGRKNGPYQVYAVNFNHILNTGEIMVVSERPWSKTQNNQIIDWKKDDAFNRIFKEMEEKVFKAIQSDPILQTRLNKKTWSRQDREAWEKGCSEIVSKIVNDVPGLDHYNRGFSEIDKFLSMSGQEIAPKPNPRYLNGLSENVEKSTPATKFACLQMSGVEGCLLQRAENHFLPGSSDSSRFKQRLSYFMTDGGYSQFKGDSIGSHAFIVTPLGNIVESTIDPDEFTESPYIRSLNDYSLEKLAKGEAFLGTDDSVYGDLYDTTADHDRFRTTEFKGRGMSAADVSECVSSFNENIMEGTYSHLPDHGIFVMLRPFYAEVKGYGENPNQFEIYKLEDEGSPNERYTRIHAEYMEASKEGSFEYKDVLKGESYKFEVQFDPKSCAPVINIYKKDHYEYWWDSDYQKIEPADGKLPEDIRLFFAENKEGVSRVLPVTPEPLSQSYTPAILA
ncbi:MAG: hypothetical protein K9G62_05510 [Alphaproteobacteria bacterium]|nr:hypothetical protein [Alphaproteobacteria bacterium]